MDRDTHFLSFFHTVKHIFSHAAVTLLAVGVAFSLPMAAQYILYTWWPRVESNSKLLMITEISFAAVLVALFNLILVARAGRRSLRMNRIASLVHVREGDSWFSRWSDRDMRNKIRGARDVSVMSVTGYDTFVSEKRDLHRFIDDSYELRVMLMNPYGAGAKRRVQSLGELASIEDYMRETEATIERLASLAAAGKKVTLKFYEDPPFWNLIITGEYVWVQYCHDGHELKTQPEYVFALRKDRPAQGLFSPFYVHFLNQWDDPRHPEYNFANKELVYRNEKGNEVGCIPYPPKKERREETRLVMVAS
ncbi:hypothetical protein SKTS_18950 [Sulfurimicrobium lacus]|uniref:Uncharacterized protein n=1 Tax=Sulfurimicrobium lacus TaxID=2715678 RepID=A0A6F8VE51_9PROT|nr:hypothetical protein [Sulfurimicrobium lacus]BCB27009.1 hypothetical protein SKTS_18950 [Sulfurimicrobium lacus]